MDVQSIDLWYGDTPVIEDLSMTVFAGTFIGLLGPNGAGKTTLLLSLSGQFKPYTGRILFDRYDIYERNIEFKRMVGYVHETPFSYPYLTVEEFLYFVAGVREIRKHDVESRISSVLQTVCLQDEREKPTAHLSMGMRKKLAIAAALLGAPRMLFLDEALNGIDIESAFHIKRVLKDFVANGGTIILSTHVLEVIEKICDRYVVLKNGEIIADFAADAFRTSDTAGEDIDLEQYIIQLLHA